MLKESQRLEQKRTKEEFKVEEKSFLFVVTNQTSKKREDTENKR